MKSDDAPLPPGLFRVPVRVHRDGQTRDAADWLAEEVPVALVMNGISQAVMLASPLDLEDFALGFALTEGFLLRPEELYGIDLLPGAQGITVEMEIASAAFARLKERRRSLAGRTGCGLCGIESLAEVALPLPPRAPSPPVQAAAIVRAMAALPALQTLQQATGAVHAAAWCDETGRIRLVREDVGRHNALDKLIGALARGRVPTEGGFCCITSRASFEMVQKAAMAGIGTLAAVSAPTARACRTAIDGGVALAGFVRGSALNVYAHPERILFDPLP